MREKGKTKGSRLHKRLRGLIPQEITEKRENNIEINPNRVGSEFLKRGGEKIFESSSIFL